MPSCDRWGRSIHVSLLRAALCAGLLVSAPAPAAEPHCPHEAAHARPVAGMRPHADHNPKHGGVFFMASNQQFHLEGVYLGSRTIKIYLYDEYTRPISAAKVEGTVELRNEPGAKPIPLRLAEDGTLVAELPPRPFPVVVDAFLRFSGTADAPAAEPDVFTFEFDQVSVDPGAGTAETERPKGAS